MFAKIEVNGPNAHPLYQALKKAAPGIFGTETIKWNFTKFLVDPKGNVVARFAPDRQARKPGRCHRGGAAGLSTTMRRWPAASAAARQRRAICSAAAAATPARLAELENAYADFNDAQGAVSLIDSDPARFQEQATQAGHAHSGAMSMWPAARR